MNKKFFSLLRFDSFFLKMGNNSLFDLPTPSKISYKWNFGSVLGILFSFQLIRGVLLSMYYTPDMELAFLSVKKLSREIEGGWLIRFFHVGGASAYFFFIYLHIARGLWKFSYLYTPSTWLIGTIIFIGSMAVAFLGYVLPWGQMSFWGATVITKFFSVIPYFGKIFVSWLWGGFSVKNPTLVRFFSLHYLLPFLIVFLIVVHFLFLHSNGSSNPLKINIVEKSTFFPYFYYKDILGFILGIGFSYYLMFCFPTISLEEQNFVSAKFLVTPEHIQPEWYFLAAYAILRAIPNKLGGVLALVFFIVILIFLPFIKRSSRRYYSSTKKTLNEFFLIFFFLNFIFLTYIGAQPVEDPFIFCSQLGFFFYFIYYFFLFFLFL